jgi:opacity protein-like surface antigen
MGTQFNRQFLLVITLALLTFSRVAGAQTRQGDVDYYGMVGYSSGTGGQLKNLPNVHYSIDHLWSWGGGGGYFVTDKLSVLFDMQFGNSSLRLDQPSTPNSSITQTAYHFSGRLNLEFTPFAGALSPVVTAGIGFANLQTAVPGAPPQIYCAPTVFYWWCGTGVPTFSETAFAYNVGFGGRWDITPSLFLKLMYSSNWADYGGLPTQRTDQILLQLGGRVKAQL